MKVFALNASPRKAGQSKTEMMLRHLTEGMTEAGAQVDVVNLREKKIRNCIGCYTCWTKTPGRCIHKDDMTQELLPRLLAAEVVVYATPLYNRLMTSSMKDFVERTLPAFEPYFEQDQGRSFHPIRATYPDVVMLSVAGFPEIEEFEILSAYARYNFSKFGRKLLAEIYRPAVEAMASPIFKDKMEEILAATHQAGWELVTSGQVSSSTLETIQQPLCDSHHLAQISNAHWKTCLAKGMTPREISAKGIMPRPDSVETYLTFLKYGFKPKAASNLQAIIAFEFTGDTNANCHIQIKNGGITTAMGSPSAADLTIHTPFELWMDITTGLADGQQTFMAQEYTIEGDFNLLIQFRELFND